VTQSTGPENRAWQILGAYTPAFLMSSGGWTVWDNLAAAAENGCSADLTYGYARYANGEDTPQQLDAVLADCWEIVTGLELPAGPDAAPAGLDDGSAALKEYVESTVPGQSEGLREWVAGQLAALRQELQDAWAGGYGEWPQEAGDGTAAGYTDEYDGGDLYTTGDPYAADSPYVPDADAEAAAVRQELAGILAEACARVPGSEGLSAADLAEVLARLIDQSRPAGQVPAGWADQRP